MIIKQSTKKHSPYFFKIKFFLNLFKFIFYYYFFPLWYYTIFYLLFFLFLPPFHIKFYNQLLSNYDTNLKILLQLGITTPDFYGNVVYKLCNIMGHGKNDIAQSKNTWMPIRQCQLIGLVLGETHCLTNA